MGAFVGIHGSKGQNVWRTWLHGTAQGKSRRCGHPVGHPGMPFICRDIPFTLQFVNHTVGILTNDGRYMIGSVLKIKEGPGQKSGSMCLDGWCFCCKGFTDSNQNAWKFGAPGELNEMLHPVSHVFIMHHIIYIYIYVEISMMLYDKCHPYIIIMHPMGGICIDLYYSVQAAMVALPWSQEEAFPLTSPTTYENLCKGCAWWIVAYSTALGCFTPILVAHTVILFFDAFWQNVR